MLKKSFTLLFVLYLFSCSNETKTSHKFLKKRVDFKKEQAIKYADIILDKNIYVWHYWEPVTYEKNIDWEADPYKNPSWVLYLHSLRMVGILAKAYEYQEEDRYVEKALEIIHSWDSFDTGNVTYWYDHMVANRVLNISHFYYLVQEKLSENDKNKITSILKKHGDWLFNDKNYTRGNHAIMLDRALLQLSLTMNESTWYKKAMKRANKIFEEEITSEGVCVENSPSYHHHVMDLVNDFVVLHKNFNKKLSNTFSENYQKMQDHLPYLIKPNNTFPALGDTYFLKHPLMLSKKYDHKKLLFIDSNGMKGEAPEKINNVYPSSGYTIFRDGWNEGDAFSKSTYMIITNTNQSLVHKHSDNLSFELYANDENLIVDPGTMGYKLDEYRAYFTSTIAHNTLTVDGMNYDHKFIELNTSASIKQLNEYKNYAIVNHVFTPNEDESYQREVLFIKPNIFIFKDKVTLNKPECYNYFQQTFNFGNTIKNMNLENKERTVASFKNNELLILQKSKIDSLAIFNGEKNLRGTLANGALKKTKSKQLVFSKKVEKKEAMYVTAFIIKNNLEKNIKEKNLTIMIDNKDVSVKWSIDNQKQFVTF